MRMERAFFMLLAILVGGAQAEVEVIHDTRDTSPIEPYMKPWRNIQKAALNKERTTRARRQNEAAALLKKMFPIETPEMSVGRVQSKGMTPALQKQFALKGAFFLLGSDETSISWLKANKAVILQRGAVGILVQAQSKEDWMRVRNVGAGLSITPMSGTAFAEGLGLMHYPVLISQKGFEQ